MWCVCVLVCVCVCVCVCMCVWNLTSIGFKLNTLHAFLPEDSCRSEDSILFLYAIFIFRFFVFNKKKNRDEWKNLIFPLVAIHNVLEDSVLLIMTKFGCAHSLKFQEYFHWILCDCFHVPRVIKTRKCCCYEMCSSAERSTVTRSVFVGANKLLDWNWVQNKGHSKYAESFRNFSPFDVIITQK